MRLGCNRLHMAREHSTVVHLISTLNKDASEDVKELRILRNQADYDLAWAQEDIAKRANAAILLATSRMNQLEVLQNGH